MKKISLKSIWVACLAVLAATVSLALLRPATVSADTCDPSQCVYASACYSVGACAPDGQECGANGTWMSVKDSQTQCQLIT